MASEIRMIRHPRSGESYVVRVAWVEATGAMRLLEAAGPVGNGEITSLHAAEMYLRNQDAGTLADDAVWLRNELLAHRATAATFEITEQAR